MSGALRVWACGCSHVAADKAAGRESLADAIRQSETGDGDPHLAFDWDVCLNLGDFSAAHGLPTEEEGEEIVRQFGALTRHRREDVYTLCGNHDRGAPGEPPGRWFRRYVDPFGENTAVSGVDRGRYRHPVHGDWERYWFEVGNVRFLMMSDVNEPSQPLGRGALGGNPGGGVSGETFDWWVDQVTSRHRDRIIVTAPTFIEYGVKDAYFDVKWMFSAPAGLPADAARAYTGALEAATRDEKLKELIQDRLSLKLEFTSGERLLEELRRARES